ncbi:MAG: succinate-semialdehyde dehydrogenase (NADP(+)) [Planctomycetaceae bacterium]|nr:succinate-semialdehyde dehydrogenase (NADP(+)) [Planctomycetaceae bacterium]
MLDIPSSILLIDGQWCDADSGRTYEVINPAKEDTLLSVAYGGQAETRRALTAAARAMPAWRNENAWGRAAVLKRVADQLRDEAPRIARVLTLEQGKPLAEANGEVLHAADEFEWFAEEAKRAYGDVIPQAKNQKRHFTLKHPVGVVGAIVPWNFPIALMARKLAPALAAGCTVVAKPASQTPLATAQLFRVMLEAGVPPGVANLIVGDASEVAAEFLANRICRKVSFTGSTEVGKQLMRGCADQLKRVGLELGGHAPFIIFPDADPEMIAQLAVAGKFRNNGQVCIAPSRFYVHRDTASEFTEAVVAQTQQLKLGDGLEEGVEIGPMFEDRAMQHAVNLVEDAKRCGARILTGGQRSAQFERGYFFEPTVLDRVPDTARLLVDEPFAPVMPVIEFENLDQVIEAANDTPYGLAAYVFTNDVSTTWRMAEGLEAGIIGINDPVPTAVQCPFGGMKESGQGRELGREGLAAYLETKYVSVGIKHE